MHIHYLSILLGLLLGAIPLACLIIHFYISAWLTRMKECSASKSELTITRKTTRHDEYFSCTCGKRWDVLLSLKASFFA